MNLIGMQLQEKKNKILVICPHPVGYVPGQRLKFEQYFKNWEVAGYEVTVSPFMSEDMQNVVYKKGFILVKILWTLNGYIRRYIGLFTIRQYDIIYLFLWGTPFGLPIFEWFVRKLSRKLIYDLDDMVHLGNTSEHNRIIKGLKSTKKVKFLAKNSNHIITSTPKLVEFLNNYGSNISLIPATIDTNRYKPLIQEETKEICIGWSGSHTTSKYLHLLDDVLKNISNKYPVKILVMGDPFFEIKGLKNLELINWSAENELSNLQKFSIGLHPLPDEEWVYGKSGGKLVQYMAVGIPTIATAIGPNYDAIKEGYNGFLVKSEQEWIDKLELLILNQNLRRTMGLNARNFAVENFSLESNSEKYLTALRS